MPALAVAPASQRRTWRLALVSLGLAALATAAVGVGRGYAALCAGPVDTYPALAAARDQAAQQASAAPPDSPPAAVAGAQARLLDLVLTVKQSDYVAFPGHAVAGLALERGGCPASATADQWRKAAGHAWFDWPARVAAGGLARTSKAQQPTQTIAALDAYASAEPWHQSNLRRVEALYLQLMARTR